MRTAWYIGDHKKDTLLARVGYWLIRFGQVRQRFGGHTHVEAIISGPWWNATIIGATRRKEDGACVRIKTTGLTPGNWLILDVPAWDHAEFMKRAKPLLGTPYSDVGAAASASMFVGFILWCAGVVIENLDQWCSRFILQSAGVEGAEDFNVAEAFTLAKSLPGSVDVTAEYFAASKPTT